MKNRLNVILFCVAVPAAMLLTGCASTVNSVENAEQVGRRNMISDQRVITDPGLNRRVSIVGVNTAMTPGGLLKAQVELENRTGSTQRFLYKFEWFDASHMQVDSVVSASTPDQIEGKESKMIWSVAPNPGCNDFRLKLISAD
jgi:uncharacterized protein YcfL